MACKGKIPLIYNVFLRELGFLKNLAGLLLKQCVINPLFLPKMVSHMYFSKPEPLHCIEIQQSRMQAFTCRLIKIINQANLAHPSFDSC